MMLVACVVVIALAYVGDRRDQRSAALDRLGTITSTLAAQINADHVARILDKYDARGMVIKNTQDAWYYVIHDHLRKAMDRNDLRDPIRVLHHDERKQELQVVITSDGTPSFRTPYGSDPAPVLKAYHDGAHLEPAGDDASELIAFDPLMDATGAVQGIIMCTMNVDVPDALARQGLWRNLTIALVLFAMAGVFLFTSVGRWLKSDEADHDELVQRHSGVTDSIAYAGKIQRALVPSPSDYAAVFQESFVIDRPKDVVSGDFHWVHRVNEHVCFVAAADCTGHGLPGAMMAAIGCSLLNEVIARNEDMDPARILGMLNTRMVTTLHQQGKSRGAGDGMDIALCRIDRANHEILFAGAMRPLYWAHRDRFTVINGDRKPVGGAHHELDRSYTVHRLAYSPGDRIYLFSDGYVDQFGGPERKRFMSDRLKTLLDNNHTLPMDRQADILEKTFLDWKGAEEQVDDVCMLGIAV